MVSASALVSWCAGRIEIASPFSGVVLRTDNPDVLHVLHAFARARQIDEALREIGGYKRGQMLACVDELIDAGVLVSAAAVDPMTAHYWERNALAFHRRSRRPDLKARSPHGTSAAVASRAQTMILLDRPSPERGRDFADVLDARHSSRAWRSGAIARATFSSLLWMSARDRDVVPGYPRGGRVSRPYPSGGAVYSLELYPVIAPGAVESVAAGVYRYLPDLHGLETLSDDAATYVSFLEAAGRSAGSHAPPVFLAITSRFATQGRAYGDLAYSLVLKEVGSLFQTLYLVSEYLGLAACALGGGTPDGLLARVCDTTELAEPVVGEFIVGPR